MSSIYSVSDLPEPIQPVFEGVKSRLVADDQFGHIEWRDRVTLWQTMNAVHGFGPSDCRRAVLCARTVWPLLLIWEQATRQCPEMLPSPEYAVYPREYLRNCTLAFLEKMSRMDTRTEQTQRRNLENLWDDEFYPLAAIMPAILYAGNYLFFAHIDNVESEYEQEAWSKVLAGLCKELGEDDGACDWEEYECHFWASEAVGGDLRKPSHDVAKRKQFWEEWLDHFIDVNVIPIAKLKHSLNVYLKS